MHLMPPGKRLLLSAEHRFGKMALSGILRWIAGFQILGFLLVRFSKGFAETIDFDRAKILSGQVWRLFSWIFIPTVDNFLIILVAFFLFFLNDALEEAMGTFRLNLYVGSIILFLSIGGMSLISNVFFVGAMSSIFLSAMVFAAACYYPNYVIHLMAIIPIKLKWLALVNAALLFAFVAGTHIVINGLLTLFALVPFLATIFPSVVIDLKNSAEASTRRSRFQKSASGHGDAFHTCHLCGVTDEADPEREFRVSSLDGEEYCLPCLEKTEEQNRAAS